MIDQSWQIRHTSSSDRAVFSASGKQTVSEGRTSNARVGGRPLRILLAEDNPADVFLFRLALTEYAVPTELTVAKDGTSVLEILGGHDFDILILDLNLPGVGGEEILWKLTAASETDKPAIPVVVFSAVRVMPRDAPGAHACVVKPEGLDEYLKAVRRICDTWLSPTGLV